MSNQEELDHVEPEVVFTEHSDPKQPSKRPVRRAKYSGRILAHMKNGEVKAFDDEDACDAWLRGKSPAKKKTAGQSKPQPPPPPKSDDAPEVTGGEGE